MAPSSRLAARTLPSLLRLSKTRSPTVVRRQATAAATAASRTVTSFSTSAPSYRPVQTRSCWSLAVRPAATPAAHRTYSTESASAPPPESKIWSFDDVQKLTKATDSPVVIVDVREPHELQDTGRIPGAINIPVSSAPESFFLNEEEFEDKYNFARPSPDTEVVFYCKAGVRSRAAAGLAKEAGWKKVGEYPGSWMDWAASGGAVEH